VLSAQGAIEMNFFFPKFFKLAVWALLDISTCI
jgi:hypothetical protein